MSIPRERLDEVGKKIKRETDVAGADSMARRQLLGSAGALNRITPCAACKLLRRRCAQECPFSPYFSPHDPQKFASVHKVFGASNVSKMLMEVPENQRVDATNSLVYEANIRLRDPVYGCMGIISSLQQQVQALEAELTAVRGEILKCKYRQASTAAGVAAAVLPTPLSSSSAAAAALFASSGEMMISVAAFPPPPPPPPARAAAASSSSSSMYAAASSSTDYSSITNENVSFFG